MTSLTTRVSSITLAFAAWMFSQSALATDIGAPAGGFFSQIGAFLQGFVDFLEGPWGIFVPIVGLSIAVAVWMFSTKGNESLGWVGRVVVGSLMIINIPSLVIAIQGF